MSLPSFNTVSSTSNHFSPSPLDMSNLPPEKTVDEVCCELLDSLFPRAGGTIWKGPVILKLKVAPLLPPSLIRKRTYSKHNTSMSQCTGCTIEGHYRLLFSFA